MSNIGNSTLAFYARSTTQMGAIRRDAEALQSQLSSGARLTRSSDDPVAASRLRMLERIDRLAAIDSANAARANDELSLASSTLQTVAQDIVRARELAIWASNQATSPEDRAAIGQELLQLRQAILTSANARDTNGNTLFGGASAETAYTVDAAGAAVYVGTAASGELALGDGQSVTRGVTGPEFINFTSGGASMDLLAFLKDFGEALQSGTGDPVAISTAASDTLKDALGTVNRTQTIIGSRLAWVETVQDRHLVKAESRAAQTADVGGVDFAAAVVELQQAMTVLEASQAGFSRLSSLSLFKSI